MRRRVAAVTMAYNEQNKLPRWLRHYAAQVNGPANLFVIDHGSSDGSTENLGPVNVVRLPREVGQGSYQQWRVRFASDFCDRLLHDYEAIFYVDADELVVADPNRFRSLYEYIAETDQRSSVAIGFDVIHDAKTEAPLDDRYLFEQRHRLQFVAAMCKPVLVTAHTRWAPGFHCSSSRPTFGDLSLFHLRYADLQEGLVRLQVTRSIDRPDMRGNFIDHHKLSDDTFAAWMASFASLEVESGPIDLTSPTIAGYMAGFNYTLDETGIYRFDYSMRSKVLFTVPRLFRYLV